MSVIINGREVFNDTDINNPDIDGGTIENATISKSNVTVGTGKTLNVSEGILTLADNQIGDKKVIAATTTVRGSVQLATEEQTLGGTSETLVVTPKSLKHVIDSSSYYEVPVPIASGGTGQSTAANAFDALKQSATDSYTGVVELATNAETATGTDTSRATTPDDLKYRHDSEAENYTEQIQYPIPSTGYMLKAASDGSPAVATNTDTDVADAVTKKHTQNTDTGTTATTFKINTGGNEADIQTTGLTGDRDYTLPDIDTMLAGSILTAENNFEIIEYT